MNLTLHTLTGDADGAEGLGSGGAALRSFELSAESPALIGRSASCEVCLPDERVSRKHASLIYRHPSWFLMDLGSSHGTHLNGQKLQPNQPTPIEPGDLIRVMDWTFRVFVGSVAPPTARTIDDTNAANARIQPVAPLRSQSQSARCLRLLADSMATFHNAPDERALAEAAVRTALEGSGFTRAAALVRTGSDAGPSAAGRAHADAESVSVLASALGDPSDRSEFVFSGSLVRQAAAGQTAILNGSSAALTHSIADLSIHSALCAPVFLGDVVEGFLYLDARGREASAHAEATVFCQAVARAYGLALANLKRRELERRQASLHAELHAAREAQEFILPPPTDDLGFLRYAMQMRPGLFVAGDLFDVVRLDDGRVALCFGDVAGHGVGSAMLMAATQSHLNAQIRATGDPAAALASVNRYLTDRLSPGRFVTIWLGVFGPDGTLTYVDAGHGYWIVQDPGTHAGDIASPRGIPIGIFPDTRYAAHTLKLTPRSRVVLYSDGVVDERDAEGREFGRERLCDVLRDSTGASDDIARIFRAIEGLNAGSAITFHDDATAASIEYVG